MLREAVAKDRKTPTDAAEAPQSKAHAPSPALIPSDGDSNSDSDSNGSDNNNSDGNATAAAHRDSDEAPTRRKIKRRKAGKFVGRAAAASAAAAASPDVFESEGEEARGRGGDELDNSIPRKGEGGADIQPDSQVDIQGTAYISCTRIFWTWVTSCMYFEVTSYFVFGGSAGLVSCGHSEAAGSSDTLSILLVSLTTSFRDQISTDKLRTVTHAHSRMIVGVTFRKTILRISATES